MSTLSGFEFSRLLGSLIALMVTANLLGFLFQKAKMPKVIGEIGGGLLLGPTILGFFYPAGHAFFFVSFPEIGKLFSFVSSLGLIFLMFISGFEIKERITGPDRKIVGGLLLGATIIPLLSGLFLPYLININQFLGPADNHMALIAVLALAIAVTSIPVIAKIFFDLGLIQTRFARLVLAVATIEDIILWGILGVISGVVVTHTATLRSVIISLIITISFFVVALGIMPRCIKPLTTARFNIFMKSSPLLYILLICFIFSFVAGILNVNVVFGALLAGIVVGRMDDERFEKSKNSIKEFSTAWLIPLYFAMVGLKLDLIHAFSLKMFIVFLLFALFCKTVGTLLAARLLKINWPSSVNFAIALNARGGPGIVLATVAYDLQIINQGLFVILVMTAIITSLVAGAWFRYQHEKGRELFFEEVKAI